MKIEFDEKTIVVVGANRGIGYQVAKAFAESGGNVTIMAEAEDIFAAAERMSGETGKAINSQICDITDVDSLTAAFNSFDSIDILICNSGFGAASSILEPVEKVADIYRKLVHINVLGALLTTQVIAPKLHSGSRLIYTASTYSKSPERGFAAYSATKYATLGLMRSVAKELGPKGINVNAVCPGPILNEITEANAAKAGLSPDEHMSYVTHKQVLNRGVIKMDDLVGAYLFLASGAASEITGQALNVDKGEAMM